MKTTKIIYLLFLLIVVSCQQKQVKTENNERGEPIFVVQPEMHYFGELESGEVVSYAFKITNAGTGPLIIDSISSSCGCIFTSLDKYSISKNESIYLHVTYDTAGEWGNSYKSIQIFSNANPQKQELTVTAKVNNNLFK